MRFSIYEFYFMNMTTVKVKFKSNLFYQVWNIYIFTLLKYVIAQFSLKLHSSNVFIMQK